MAVVPALYGMILAGQQGVETYAQASEWLKEGHLNDLGGVLAKVPGVGGLSQELIGRLIVTNSEVERRRPRCDNRGDVLSIGRALFSVSRCFIWTADPASRRRFSHSVGTGRVVPVVQRGGSQRCHSHRGRGRPGGPAAPSRRRGSTTPDASPFLSLVGGPRLLRISRSISQSRSPRRRPLTFVIYQEEYQQQGNGMIIGDTRDPREDLRSTDNFADKTV